MANKVVAPNELLGNFFPGGPLPQRPFKPYGSGKPVQFRKVEDAYTTFLGFMQKDIKQGLSNTLLDTGDVSLKLGDIEGTIDDLKKLFIFPIDVSVSSPSDVSSANIPVEFADDIGSLPGAVAVRLNLSPYAWIKNPAKESKGLVTSIINGTIGLDPFTGKWNFSDIDSKIEKDFIWEPLVKGKPIGLSRLSTTGSPDFFSNLLEEKLTGGKTAATSGTGIGLADPLISELADFKNPGSVYVIGQGNIYSPGNPGYSAQNEFIGSIGKLNNRQARESTHTNLGVSMLDVVDKELHRVGVENYTGLSAQANTLLNNTLAGSKSRILDLQGNDLLTSYTTTLKNYLDLRDTQLTERATLTTAVASATTIAERDAAQRKLDELLIQLSNNNERITYMTTNLLGDSTTKGLIKHIDDTVGSSGVTAADALITTFTSSLSGTTSTIADFHKSIQDGTVSALIETTRKELRNQVDTTSGSFLFREQFQILKELNGFDNFITAKMQSVNEKKRGSAEQLVALGLAKSAIDASCDKQLALIKGVEDLLSAQGNVAALEQFRTIFGTHTKSLNNMKAQLAGASSVLDFNNLGKKWVSIYSTDTLIGGLEDVITRRFRHEALYGKGPLAEALKGSNDTELNRNIKALLKMEERIYRQEVIETAIHDIDEGPKGLVSTLLKRYVKERFGFKVNLARPKEMLVDNILLPTHYFGLKFNPKVEEQMAKSKGFSRFMHDKVGVPLMNRFGLTVHEVELGTGITVGVQAGEHLKAVVALGTLLKNGTIDSATLLELLNIDKFDDFLKLPALYGKVLGVSTKDDLEKLFSQIQLFKKWLATDPKGISLATKLGLSIVGGKIKFDATNTILQSYMDKLFTNISRIFHDTSLVDPTMKFVGLLNKVSSVLSKIQTKWFVLIANFRKPVVAIKFFMTKAITSFLTGVFGAATGGLGAFIGIALEVVVAKLVDWGELFIRGLLKFNLSDFYKSINKTLGGLMQYLMLFVVAPLVIVIFGMDSIDSLLLGISPVDNSRPDGVAITDELCDPISYYPEGANAKDVDAALNALQGTYMNPFVANSGMSEENFRKCYYAVLKKAVDKKTDPALAAAIWIEESGASNYKRYPSLSVEDFGCHKSSIPKEDFKAQLDCYVNLKDFYLNVAATKCPPYLTVEKYLKIFASGDCVDYGVSTNFKDQISEIYSVLQSDGKSLNFGKQIDSSTLYFSD